ncbi:MAG: ABC transporter ATP-binding protein [Bacteroidota bacterium]
MAKILEIEGLSKSYDGKKYALFDCSFTLQSGKICAIVGESGSGKSTLLRLIAGLERPNAGTISIKGQIVSDDNRIVPPQERNVGLVFQDFALFPHLTVEQNIAFGLKEKTKETVAYWLQLIKMEQYQKVYPATLSGGQEQRVALVRTLALNPELLLLDEPFSNLDTTLKAELRQEIRQLINRIGTSMIFITHDLLDALDIADEIILLKDGRILQHSSMSDFAKNIQHPATLKLISDLKANAERILAVLQNK